MVQHRHAAIRAGNHAQTNRGRTVCDVASDDGDVCIRRRGDQALVREALEKLQMNIGRKLNIHISSGTKVLSTTA